MRVLLISPLPPPVGGIATWTAGILKSAKSRADVEVRLLNMAVRWRRISDRSQLRRYVLGGVQSSQQLLKVLWLLLWARPDVVHLCSAAEIGLARDCLILLAAKLLRIPAIIHFHRGKSPDFPELLQSQNKSLEARLVRIACWLASRVIVLNGPALVALGKIANGKCVMIENGIDREHLRDYGNSRPLTLDKGPLKIIFVGYVSERKGIFDLFAIFDELARRSDVQLLVVGPFETDVRDALMASISTKAAVTFTGSLEAEAVYAALAEAEVFCLPSYAEGLPYAVLEAMALGKAIVSTNVGGIPEALQNDSGICICPGDRAALLRALTALAHDRPGRLKLGERAALRSAVVYDLPITFNKILHEWAALSHGQ